MYNTLARSFYSTKYLKFRGEKMSYSSKTLYSSRNKNPEDTKNLHYGFFYMVNRG